MNYIVTQLDKNPDVIPGIFTELATSDEASKISFTTIASDINELNLGLAKLQKNIDAVREGPAPSAEERFMKIIPAVHKAFLDEVASYVALSETIAKDFARVEEMYRGSTGSQPEEFFGQVARFLEILKGAKIALDREKLKLNSPVVAGTPDKSSSSSSGGSTSPRERTAAPPKSPGPSAPKSGPDGRQIPMNFLSDLSGKLKSKK